VLAVHKLREKFSRILYVDFDLHHGEYYGFVKALFLVVLHPGERAQELLRQHESGLSLL
jgi:hypothetical protein